MPGAFMRRTAIRITFVIVALAAGAFAIGDVARRSVGTQAP